MPRSFALFLVFVFSITSILSAETTGDRGWSVDFGAISVSEALNQLASATGIKIVTKTHFRHKISPKRYINQDIEKILKDILKCVNYALIWHYNENGLRSITILAFDRNKTKASAALPSPERGDKKSDPPSIATHKTSHFPAGNLDTEFTESSAGMEQTEEGESLEEHKELTRFAEESPYIPQAILLDKSAEPDEGSPEKEEIPSEDQGSMEESATD